MREADYIRASNNQYLRLALHCLREVLPGPAYGVEAQALARVRHLLSALQEASAQQITLQDFGQMVPE